MTVTGLQISGWDPQCFWMELRVVIGIRRYYFMVPVNFTESVRCVVEESHGD